MFPYCILKKTLLAQSVLYSRQPLLVLGLVHSMLER